MERKLNVHDGEYTLSFELNQGHTFVACVPLPYILLKGSIQWHPNNYNITYDRCTLHTCIDALMLVCYWMSLLKAYIFLEQGQQSGFH